MEVCYQLSFSIILHISDCSLVRMNAPFGDYGQFFASETFTWYHHCSQERSGYGQPDATVKCEHIFTQIASARPGIELSIIAVSVTHAFLLGYHACNVNVGTWYLFCSIIQFLPYVFFFIIACCFKLTLGLSASLDLPTFDHLFK